MDFEPRMPDEVWGLWIRVANGWAPALQATGGRVWFRSRRLAEVYADKLQARYQFDCQAVRLDRPDRPRGVLARWWEARRKIRQAKVAIKWERERRSVLDRLSKKCGMGKAE